MPTIADLQVKFSAETSGLKQGAGEAQGLIGSLTSGARGLATVAGGMILGTAIQQVVGGVAQLAGAGLDFEANMANVNSIAQMSGGEIDALSQQVLDLARNPAIIDGPAKLSAGLYDIYSSGFQGADALNILETSAKAATAGMTTTDVASRAVTSALNAFGLQATDAGRVSDVMFQTVNKGVITFDQLANNLGNTMPIANALGLSIEDLGASYALMTLKGVSASQAETQIAALMRTALNPTQAMTDAMVQYGDGTAEATIANRGFAGFLDVINKAAGGNKEKMMEMLGTQEAMNAALILGAEDGQDYAAMLEEMMGASEGAGATNEALAKQMESARFKIAEAKKQVEILAVTLMGLLAPAIGAAAGAFSRGVSAVTDFVGSIVDLGREAKLMYDTGGVFLESWLAKMPGYLQPVAKLFFDLIDPLGDVGDAFQALKEGDFDEMFDELGEAAGGFADAISNFAGTVWDNFLAIDWGGIADSVWGAVSGAFTGINWGAVWDTVTSAITTAAGAGITIGEFVISAAAKLGGEIANAAADLYGWVKGKLFGGGLVGDGTGGPEPGAGMGTYTLSDVVLAAGAKLGGEIANAAKDLWGWIKGKLGVGGISGGGAPAGTGSAAGSAFGGNEITLSDVILNAGVKVEKILSAARDAFSGLIQDIQDLLDTHKETIRRAASALFDFDIGRDFGNNLGQRFGNWLNGLDWSGLFGQAATIAAALGRGLMALAVTAVTGLATLGAGVTQVGSAIVGFFVGAVSAIDWGRFGSAIKTGIMSAVNGIFSGGVLDQAADMVNGFSAWGLKVVQALSDAAVKALNDSGTFALDLIAALKEKITGMDIQPDAILSLGAKIGNAISGAAKRGIDALSGSEMITSLKAKLDGLPFDVGSILGLGARVGTAISGAVKRGIDALSGSEMISTLTSKIDGLTATAADFGSMASSIGTAIWNAIKDAVPDISVQQILDWAGLGGLGAFLPVSNAGGGGAGQPQELGWDMPGGAIPTQGGAGGGIGSILGQVQGMGSQITGAVATLAAAVRAAAARIPSEFQAALAPLPGIGANIANQLRGQFQSAIAPMPSQARQVAAQTAQSITQALQPLPGQTRATGAQVASGFQQAIAPMPGQARSVASQTAQAITQALAPLPAAGRSAGSQTASNFNSGISQISQATGTVRGAVSSIQGSLAGASSGAYGYGYAVGDQFASGLEASLGRVLAAAASIRNAMPSSPAKIGPLSEPISFAYIPEDLERNMARMADIAMTGVGGVSVAFQQPAVSGPGVSSPMAAFGSGVYIENLTVDVSGFEDLARLQKALGPSGRAMALGFKG